MRTWTLPSSPLALTLMSVGLLAGCQPADDATTDGADATAPAAQAPDAGGRDLLADLIAQTRTVEEKIVGLARAIPESAWDWRPAEGVRSVGEVFVHVAADNYFIPALMGVAPPAESGVTGDYATVRAYEGRDVPKDQALAELEASFVFLYDALEQTRYDLDRSFEFGGTTYQVGPMWVQGITHLHEHLGQGIAYARSNGVTPPWSR